MKCWAPREYAKSEIGVHFTVFYLDSFSFSQSLTKKKAFRFSNLIVCTIFFFMCTSVFFFGLIYQDDLQLANQLQIENCLFLLNYHFSDTFIADSWYETIYCHLPFAICNYQISGVLQKSCTLFTRLFPYISSNQVFTFCEKRKAAINKSSKKYKLIIICVSQFVP